MARLWATGTELDSLTANFEWSSINSSPLITTTTVRTGTYASQVSGMTSGTKKGYKYSFANSTQTGPYFFRVYINCETLPAAENAFLTVNAGSLFSSTIAAKITIDNTGVLKLYNATTAVGSASTALSTATWYAIELWFDSSGGAGAGILKARINGAAEFASATNLTIANNIQSFQVGFNLNSEAQTTGKITFDDIAINDSTGSFQNSYPGLGQLTYLFPTADGDNHAWSVNVGGTAGAANNFSRVNEVPPDSATSYNGDNTTGHLDDYLLTATPVDVGANDTINCVMIGFIARGGGASANATTRVRCKKVTGGTVSESGTDTITSTSFAANNGTSAGQNYNLVLYQDPDGANWSKATLDTAQIGLHTIASSTNEVDVTSLWMIVDSTPAPVPTHQKKISLLGTG